VEEAFRNRPKIRFVEKGKRKGENVYLALGRTDSGRYLAILFIYKKTREALILSPRNGLQRKTAVCEKVNPKLCRGLNRLPS
jgi:uncharacterized DUF497 family protein